MGRTRSWNGWGDHITLQKNPGISIIEGLPAFDILTFRFTDQRSEAVDALLAGADLIDPNAVQDVTLAQVDNLEQQGQVSAIRSRTHAWSRSFGIVALDEQSPDVVCFERVRQRPLCASTGRRWSSSLGGRPKRPGVYCQANPC
jgi:hypothetical protein